MSRLTIATTALAVLLPGHLLPSRAGATDLGLGLSLNRTEATPGNPSEGSNALSLSGSYDLTDEISLDFGANATKPVSAKATGETVQDRSVSPTVLSLSAGSTWLPSEHWMFMGSLSFSPKSTERSYTTVAFTPAKGESIDADALLEAASSSVGLLLSAVWDQASEGDFNTSVSLTTTLNHLSTTQGIVEIQVPKSAKYPDGKAEAKEIEASCANQPGSLECKRLKPLVQKRTVGINSLPINLSVSETLYDDTEVTAGATFYLYDKNPNEVGYFTLASQGKTPQQSPTGGEPVQTGTGPSASFGQGVAIAPYLWTGSLAAAHRLGPVRLTATVGYGKYLDDAGTNRSLGLRASWKISKHWRWLASGTIQTDTDEEGDESRAFTFGSTVRYVF